MHIPDGFLDLSIALLFLVLTVVSEYYALRKTKGQITETILPKVAITTAAIFAAQMLNFPIVAGTSGHLVGGTLIGILFGPWIGMLAMTVIIIIQAFVFGDGGVLVIGANLFNMAIITPVVGYYVWQAVKKMIPDRKGDIVGAAVGAWASIVLAAIACGIQIGLSASFPFSIFETIPAMVFWHVLIGLGEAVITVAALIGISKIDPDLLDQQRLVKNE